MDKTDFASERYQKEVDDLLGPVIPSGAKRHIPRHGLSLQDWERLLHQLIPLILHVAECGGDEYADLAVLDQVIVHGQAELSSLY